ncbi:putative oxidoreductase [Psilocybe cubensis]|uniref:NAD(P)-binding protein n=2 Tax=Psilocybe cubensis TaxID=181762 RepID=A0A8H7XPV4_PSICU|nr:putative oxidoreductase [Psilocybe cubensis]KAH9478023.1 putative oxidoreductase [Psilocybe cubensis]
MPSWLITGANRGIGYSTVEALLQDDSNFVIATSRNASAPSLVALSARYPKTLRVIELDIESPTSIEKAVIASTPLLPSGLDYLINNAAKNPQPSTKFEDLDLDVFGYEMQLSTVIPLRVSRAFLPLVKKSEMKKIIFVSSVLASFETTFVMVNQMNAYSVGKASLNMLTRKWGASLKYDGVTTAAIHPGWTKTELSDCLTDWISTYAPQIPRLTTDEAAACLIKTSEALALEKTGLFWNFDGSNLAW